jgi:hypothetical protein
MIFLVL